MTTTTKYVVSIDGPWPIASGFATRFEDKHTKLKWCEQNGIVIDKCVAYMNGTDWYMSETHAAMFILQWGGIITQTMTQTMTDNI